jgi:hypothetical protein
MIVSKEKKKAKQGFVGDTSGIVILRDRLAYRSVYTRDASSKQERRTWWKVFVCLNSEIKVMGMAEVVGDVKPGFRKGNTDRMLREKWAVRAQNMLFNVALDLARYAW